LTLAVLMLGFGALAPPQRDPTTATASE